MVRVEELNGGLLAVDACILEDDDDYIVFSVRVPKNTLRENHHFLAALSDHLGETSSRAQVHRLIPARPRKTHTATWMAAVVGAALLSPLGIVLQGSTSAVSASKDPFEVVAMSPLAPVIRAGEPLEVSITMKRLATCMTTVDRLMLDRNANYRLVRSETKPAIWHGDPGETFTRSFKVPLSATLNPGDYTYRVWLHSDCTGGGSYHQQLPDVEFRVMI